MGDCAPCARPVLSPGRCFLLGLTVGGLGLPACGRTGAVPPPSPRRARPPPRRGAGASSDHERRRLDRRPPPVDVSAPPADAEREPNGVARKILARGKGTTHPTRRPASSTSATRAGSATASSSRARRPTGRRAGTSCRSSRQASRPSSRSMVEGERRRIWVPAALAYGQRPNFVNAPRGDMTFEVELVRIVPMPPVPADVKAAAQGRARRRSRGSTYVVLKKGTGKRHPTEDTRAEVIYTAWTPDGHMFQCSLASGDDLPRARQEAAARLARGDAAHGRGRQVAPVAARQARLRRPHARARRRCLSARRPVRSCSTSSS